MNIVEIKGGLGNQMFQYALYQQLKKDNENTYCFVNPRIERPFELSIFKNVSIQYADDSTYHRMNGIESIDGFVGKIARKYELPNKSIYRENEKVFDKNVFSVDGKIIKGYFQDERYFANVKDVIRNHFAFNYQVDENNSFLLDGNTVSIHIRLGDYLKRQDIYGGICTQEYYLSAITRIKELVGNPILYVFSDEIEKVKELNWFSNATFIDCTNGQKNQLPGYDMFLMSKCKHNIIANSSYSWWAAWLNGNSSKVVVAPKFFDNRYKSKKIACDDWITI